MSKGGRWKKGVCGGGVDGGIARGGGGVDSTDNYFEEKCTCFDCDMWLSHLAILR
jgi:hypothetical protein